MAWRRADDGVGGLPRLGDGGDQRARAGGRPPVAELGGVLGPGPDPRPTPRGRARPASPRAARCPSPAAGPPPARPAPRGRRRARPAPRVPRRRGARAGRWRRRPEVSWISLSMKCAVPHFSAWLTSQSTWTVRRADGVGPSMVVTVGPSGVDRAHLALAQARGPGWCRGGWAVMSEARKYSWRAEADDQRAALRRAPISSSGSSAENRARGVGAGAGAPAPFPNGLDQIPAVVLLRPGGAPARCRCRSWKTVALRLQLSRGAR